ncbi:alpha-mannosidase [candidate division KSB1 bacterium]|nr:alpha-mannosidase [candidate division KSB1 bacterium]
MPQKYCIHAIGHAHIDPVWQWDKNEGYQEVLATFRSAVERLREFPDVTFVASSAQFYEWVAEADPELFSQIKALVHADRWIPVGGWWVEADINCASGESLVRQGLYAQHFFFDHFGRKAHVGFSPDTFGHAWSLPQILLKQGMDSYIFMRPEPHEKKDLPAPLFVWQGADGSRMLTLAIVASYNADAAEIQERIDQSIARFSQTLPKIQDIALFYGVGNHGGGPTVAAIQKIDELRFHSTHTISFSSPEEYMQIISRQKDRLPILNDELQHHARGCYSACSETKQTDRQTSTMLIEAEKFAVFAHLAAQVSYPVLSLKQAWKKTLFNQFHDILAGTSIESAHRDARDDYSYGRSVAAETRMKALQALSREIQTDDRDLPFSSPLVVFNPCSWETTRFLEYETDLDCFSLHGGHSMVLRNSGGEPVDKNELVLLDSQGQPVPWQFLPTAAAKQENQPFRLRILFRARIPALGYQVYSLDYSRRYKARQVNSMIITATSMENSRVRIEFDRRSGALLSYFDKTANRELLVAPGAQALVMEDPDDTWGHRIKTYDQQVGTFSNASFDIIESGPERIRLRVRSVWGQSVILQEYSLHREAVELRVRMTVDWHEAYKVLKLSFPTAIKNGRCFFSIPYGAIERQMSGDEEPGQDWIDISTADEANIWGLAVVNDFTCGYSAKDGDIRLTCLRSTAWSHHNPEIIDEKEPYRYMEQGMHEFRYQLIPHKGDWRQARIPLKAEEERSIFPVVRSTKQRGKLEPFGSFLTMDLSNVSITAIKMAESSDSLVLRCVEILGRKARGTIDLPIVNRSFTLVIEPFEIKTFVVPKEPAEPIRETDLLEM